MISYIDNSNRDLKYNVAINKENKIFKTQTNYIDTNIN